MTAMAPARASTESTIAQYLRASSGPREDSEVLRRAGRSPAVVRVPERGPSRGAAARRLVAPPAAAPGDLDDLLDRGADVFRSVLDLASLPFYVDVDYLNARCPGMRTERPGDVFAKLEPTHQAGGGLLAK